MRLNVNTGPFVYENGSFTPAPKYGIVGNKNALYETNPRTAYGKPLAGLIVMGLTDRANHAINHSLDEVVELVKNVRIQQTSESEAPGDGGDPGSTFILQRGLFRHRTGEIIDEESVRIIILHLTDETSDEFREHLLKLAETMCEKFNQDELIVEFQKGGVTEDVVGVTHE